MKVRFGAIAIACAALAGCSLERPATAIPPVPEIQSISVQMNSWGKLVSDWTIRRDGEGRYTFSRDVAGGGFRNYDLVMKRFAVSADDFAKVETLLTPAHPFAGGKIPCRLELTDGVYGRIAWSDGGEPRGVPFDFGCLSRTAESIYRGLMDAQEHVQALAEAGEIVEVEEVREPRG